jgi:hypothetical protein
MHGDSVLWRFALGDSVKLLVSLKAEEERGEHLLNQFLRQKKRWPE